MFKIRPSWDRTFMTMAEIAAERTSCLNHKTGCIIVDMRKRIVSVGYNGPVSGDVNCSEVGCAKIHGDPETKQLKRCRGAHGEVNAVVNCIQPSNIRGATLYITTFPCFDCMKTLINAGIKEIVYKEIYRRVVEEGKTEFENEAWELALRMGVKLYLYDSSADKRIEITKVPEN
ncbi:MAG: dCMP deaminase family protein [Candidatus Aenigmatarchaeota archaeon]